MCICSLPTNTTGAEIFKSLNDYLSSKLNWSFSVGICTEGAVSMTGRPSHNPGQEVVPEWESTHCVINWEMLARCKMSPELHSLVNDVVKIINHIKANALTSCLFEQRCKEMEACCYTPKSGGFQGGDP